MNQRIKQMAINGEGFLFDPTSGESFTVNPTAALMIRGMQEGRSPKEIITRLTDTFDVPSERAERDYADFIAQLKLNQLV